MIIKKWEAGHASPGADITGLPHGPGRDEDQNRKEK